VTATHPDVPARPAGPATPAVHPNRWYAQPVQHGALVTLVPLTIEHAEGLHRALWTGDAGHEVYQWLGVAPPGTIEEVAEVIYTALASRAAGERLPYAQLDARTGEVIGTTSYYELNPAVRALAIGHTWLGRRWWRTGHNTESKLLMLTHAFDTLTAARVVWHTDMLNARSRAAIQRLGATFEGELRKHRIRANGTWRDTAQFAMIEDDWPAARAALRASLDR
jgi:RimJ/RimL family protein N-acetyltransferase